MNDTKIAFIGGGNMAASLIGGLLGGHVKPNMLWVSEPNAEQRQQLSINFNVQTTADNSTAAAQGDVVVLAVKPQVMHAVADEIKPAIQQHKPLVITIAAGIRLASIAGWLGDDIPVVRAMPNTPALVQTGASALIANQEVTAAQRNLAESIMRSVGLALWLEDEALMDVVTAVSGSGPAYFFLVMEILQAAGETLGLDRESARLLSLQTAFGSAKMALESTHDPATLRRHVTSPGGTTERAINTLLDGNIRQLFMDAVANATQRSRDLARQLGES